MDTFDLPILKKSFDLYKTFHGYRNVVPKQDRFTIYEHSEELLIEIVELFINAGYEHPDHKKSILKEADTKLILFRFFVRLMKETHTLDLKKYAVLQEMVDEIGRMLGGWIRSTPLI